MRESHRTPIKATILRSNSRNIDGIVHVLRERICPGAMGGSIAELRKVRRRIVSRQEDEDPEDEDHT